MKVKTEDILKPGAVLKVELVDFNDPVIKRLFRETRKRQEELLRLRDAPFKNVTITI